VEEYEKYLFNAKNHFKLIKIYIRDIHEKDEAVKPY